MSPREWLARVVERTEFVSDAPTQMDAGDAALSIIESGVVDDLVDFARAVLDAAAAAEAPIRGPLPPSRLVPTRTLHALADEHLGSR